MFAGDDVTPWELVGDGTTGEVHGDTIEIRIPHIAQHLGGALRFRLSGLRELGYRPTTDRWDEPEIDERARISVLAAPLDDVLTRSDGIILWGPAGRLRLLYDELVPEAAGRPIDAGELRRVVETYWADWCANAKPRVHPLIRTALVEPWDGLVEQVIATWRELRTSELAETIGILDRLLRPGAMPFTDADSIPAWCAAWASRPRAALAALAVRARSTFYDDLARELGTDDLETMQMAGGKIFRAITTCLEALGDAAPDPRIGRGLEDLLRSPSEHYFDGGEIRHVFRDPDHDRGPREPTFADRLLPLLVAHADGGSAGRFDEAARIQSIEADCNGAEMASELRRIADEVGERYPTDAVLPRDVRQALRMRRH